LRLDEIDVARCRELRRAIVDAGLGGKTVGNIVGLLRKAFNDAVEEGLIERNPVLRASSRRLRHRRRQRLTADPLTPEEIQRFLSNVPDFFRLFHLVPGWMALLRDRCDPLRLAGLHPPDSRAAARADSALGQYCGGTEDRAAFGGLFVCARDFQST